jgi:hypothetical protein
MWASGRSWWRKGEEKRFCTGRHGPLPTIFVAGTGRSGTTLLHDLIANHENVFALPEESKFIVEGDGPSSLIPALTDGYSVTSSDLALLRFMVMMGQDIPGFGGKDDSRFGRHLRTLFGPAAHDAAMAAYVSALTDFEFAGFPFPRHFEDRAELIRLTRTLIRDLFEPAARAAGKSAWLEKTPSNLIAIDFLWELFPEARILHIKRDPRGVLHSLMQQDWAPQDIVPATSFLRHIYWRWARLQPRLNLPDPRFMELKLEDLCAEPEQTLDRVAAFLDLESDFPVHKIDAKMADRWQREMPADHRRHAETRLADMFDLMGYAI